VGTKEEAAHSKQGSKGGRGQAGDRGAGIEIRDRCVGEKKRRSIEEEGMELIVILSGAGCCSKAHYHARGMSEGKDKEERRRKEQQTTTLVVGGWGDGGKGASGELGARVSERVEKQNGSVSRARREGKRRERKERTKESERKRGRQESVRMGRAWGQTCAHHARLVAIFGFLILSFPPFSLLPLFSFLSSPSLFLHLFFVPLPLRSLLPSLLRSF